MAQYICPALLNDIGYIPAELARATSTMLGSTIREIAAAVIAIDNANRMVKNYKKQRDISDRVLKIAEEQQLHLQTVFWPRDAQFLAEFSEPEVIEAVEVMGRRYAGRMIATIAGAFAEKLKENRCMASRYCTSATSKSTQDLLMARSAAMASARVLGRNIAFAEFQARSDTNLQRRMQAVALGRNLMEQAATLYASAGVALAQVGSMLGNSLSGALESFKVHDTDRRSAKNSADKIVDSLTPSGVSLDPVEKMKVQIDEPQMIKTDFGFKTSQAGIRDEAAGDVMSKRISKVKGVDSSQFLNDQDESINAAAMGGG